MSKARREKRAQRRHRAQLSRAAGRSRKPIKMSSAIERIIEPYVDESLTIRAHRNLITACALAWNLSAMERLAKQGAPGDLVKEARADVERIGATVVVEELMKRKTALYPDDCRIIVDTSLEPLKTGGWYLNVASMSPEEMKHAARASEPADSNSTPGREVENADAASSAPAPGDPSQQRRNTGPS